MAQIEEDVKGLTRAEARAKMGEPSKSGDKGGVGLMAVEHSWDHWLIPPGKMLSVWYDGEGETISTAILGDEPPPEPKMVELQVYCDYYQFYVQDMESTADTSIVWDEPNSTENGTVVADGFIGVATKRYETVPVQVSWYPSDPGFIWDGIDRVSECGIEVTTTLGVGMPISIRPLNHIEFIEPGIYDVRVMGACFSTVKSDWDGADCYYVELWPAEKLRPLVHLKKPADSA
jgi:hypothetical protein